MPNRPDNTLSNAERKKRLLVAGALYRASIMIARDDVAASLRPGLMAKDIISRLSSAAKLLLRDSFRNPRTLSPLLIPALSLLSKRAVRKPLIYVGCITGAIAGVYYLLQRSADPK